MGSSGLAIEVVDLVKRFPKQPGWHNLFRKGQEKVVLDAISLAIPRGEIFGLLGPNGAGKTTLTKILCTLITPTSGLVRVAGYDVVGQEQEVRRRIGLVYGDQRSFFWRLTLLENLRFYAALYEIPAEFAERRIGELIDVVGLQDASRLRMHYFSSGMKQRASIARGLLCDPEIILLDEPTTSVDPIAAHQVRMMVRDLIAQDGRRTVLLTTNVMEEAELLCDRIALLNHGRVELTGSVSAMRNRFQVDDVYVVTVQGAEDRVVSGLRDLPGVHEIVTVPCDAGRLAVKLTVRRGSAAIPDVHRRLVAANVDVWTCTKEELSLDEMFRITFEQPPRRIEATTPVVVRSLT